MGCLVNLEIWKKCVVDYVPLSGAMKCQKQKADPSFKQ
jgi:hypothetical protein